MLFTYLFLPTPLGESCCALDRQHSPPLFFFLHRRISQIWHSFSSTFPNCSCLSKFRFQSLTSRTMPFKKNSLIKRSHPQKNLVLYSSGCRENIVKMFYINFGRKHKSGPNIQIAGRLSSPNGRCDNSAQVLEKLLE